MSNESTDCKKKHFKAFTTLIPPTFSTINWEGLLTGFVYEVHFSLYYCVSNKSYPFLYIESPYINGQDSMNIHYMSERSNFWRIKNGS